MSKRDRRYDSARWRRLRLRIIARDGGRCVSPGCHADTSRPRTLHVDHIREVRDDGDFWDPANLETLCRGHHAAKTLTVAAERGGGARTSGVLTWAEYAALPGPSREW